MGAGRPLYHVSRVVEETGTYFGDGSHIIYVNGSFKDDIDPAGRLMHGFRCLSSADMFHPALARQVKFFKETEGGREIMCQIIEELAEKRAMEEKEAAARRMIASGKLTVEEIAEFAGLPIEFVRNLAGLQLA